MMDEAIIVSTSDRGVLTVTFNRPDRANSYDAAMLDCVERAFETAYSDASVRVVVLRGAGKHFSSGAAIGSGGGKARRSMGDLCRMIEGLPKPSIAAVQGACIGGALAMASCCDCMVSSRDASFSIPEVRLGFSPSPLIPVFMRAVGYRAMRRYLLSGERFSAQEALRIGLVHELCAPEELETALDRIVSGYLRAAPEAFATAKSALIGYMSPELPDEATLRDLQAGFDRMSESDEAREGRASFSERREPRWYPARRL